MMTFSKKQIYHRSFGVFEILNFCKICHMLAYTAHSEKWFCQNKTSRYRGFDLPHICKKNYVSVFFFQFTVCLLWVKHMIYRVTRLKNSKLQFSYTCKWFTKVYSRKWLQYSLPPPQTNVVLSVDNRMSLLSENRILI